MKRLLTLLLLFVGTCAVGQTPKTKIYVECTCQDIVGAQYATALRDAIARSPRYELADSPEEGSGSNASYNWTLSIVTVDDMPNSPGTSTAISVVLKVGLLMVDQSVQTCGVNAVASCASTTLASADADLQKKS